MKSEDIQNKYVGKKASLYDEKRRSSNKWHNEQDAVELLLNKATMDSKIKSLLDIPVGTGRFFNIYYGTELNVTGIDISDDMLKQAEEKANKNHMDVSFSSGDILDVSTIGTNPDIVVCIRLLNWFSFDEVVDVLENIDDLGVKYAIVGIRTQSKQEMGMKKKVWLLQAQIISNLLNRRWSDVLNRESSDSGINIHPKDEFLAQVKSNNFAIENRVLVDIGSSLSNFESEYYIYLLKSSDL